MGPRLPALTLPFLLVLACSRDPGADGLAVDPPEPVVQVEGRLALQVLTEDPLAEEPTWEMLEFHGGGFLNRRGARVTYLAPEGANTYHLVLRARRFDGVPMRRIIPVRVLPVVTVSPSSMRLSPGGTCLFTARIKGMARARVVWAVEEAEGGTITEDGTYTAPERLGRFHVVAMCSTDPEATASMMVWVE
ncbi:MAG: hypothetical protein HYZ13_09280 [Acidobacteria bacterium]|nr:hypothetical protein [Acidobacteriota bacterium]